MYTDSYTSLLGDHAIWVDELTENQPKVTEHEDQIQLNDNRETGQEMEVRETAHQEARKAAYREAHQKARGFDHADDNEFYRGR